MSLNWLPILSLATVFLLVVAANAAVFGTRGPSRLTNLDALLSTSWIDRTPGIEPAKAIGVLALRDASARLAWMVTGIIQTFSFSVFLCYTSLLFRRTIGAKNPVGSLVIVWIVLLVLGGLQFIVDHTESSLDQSMGSGLAYAGKLNKIMYNKFDVPWLNWVVKGENVLAIWVIILGTLAASAMIADASSGDHTAEWLKDRIKQLRNLLTASAIVLVIGVVQVSAEYRWPAAVVQERVNQEKSDASKSGDKVSLPLAEKVSLPLADTLTNFASAVTLMAGGTFTLFMFAIFGTSFLVLRRKVESLAYDRCGGLGVTPEVWQERNGLTLSISEWYGDLTKVIGPLTIAILGSFIKF